MRTYNRIVTLKIDDEIEQLLLKLQLKLAKELGLDKPLTRSQVIRASIYLLSYMLGVEPERQLYISGFRVAGVKRDVQVH